MTTITDIKPIDFDDDAAISKEINDFAEKYAYADVEHALEISPNGNMYSLTGTKYDVNSEIIGRDALKGSKSVHNHPVEPGKDKADSFSIKDLKFAAENNLGKQYIVSGKRRDAFEFSEYYSNSEIETAWHNAYMKVLEKHLENDTQVVFEQEEILREFKLKGFKYYENL